MAINFLLLFLFTLSPWVLFSYLPKNNDKFFGIVLSFSGAYLFSITLLHILPEIYVNSSNPQIVGAFILLGFFIQLIVSFFAKGVEHGHLHHHHSGQILPVSLVISISIHAFLEGNMLVHPLHENNAMHDNDSLLLGMILHKIPEAFALLSVLKEYKSTKLVQFYIFVLYALLSPLGMVLGNYAYLLDWMTPNVLTIVFAIIAGNFMHISTIIFFESSPRHELRFAATNAKILGALLAIVFEILI